MKALDLSGPVVEVARSLLGWRLISTVGGKSIELMVTEVEAYGGHRDPASHAFAGRSPRNGSMFGPAGTLYVYRSYGIHWCANVVTGDLGDPRAVLLRGGEIVDGSDVAIARRGRSDHLSDGPGKLCQALGITGELDGHVIDAPPLSMQRAAIPAGYEIVATPRIGISKAVERPWRFQALAPRPMR